MSRSGIELDWESANSITLLNLQDARKVLLKELERHYEHNEWMHPDDIVMNKRCIEAFEVLIPFYGGELEP